MDDFIIFMKSLFTIQHPNFPPQTADRPQYHFAWTMENIYSKSWIQSNPHFNYMLAQYYMANGLNTQAHKFFTTAEELFNENSSPSFYCDWGTNLFRCSDIELANEKFEKAAKIASDRWWLYSIWAENLSLYGNKEDSMVKDQLALDLEPKNTEFYIKSGYRLIQNTYDYEGGIQLLLQKANEIGLDPFTFYKELGIKLYNNKCFEKAKYILQEALQMNPKSALVNSWYAKSLYYNLQYEDAELKFKEADELDYNRELDKEHYELWYFTLISFDQNKKAMKVSVKLHEVEHPEDEYAEEAEYEEIKDKEINETEKQLRSLFKGFSEIPIDRHSKRTQLFRDLATNVSNPLVKLNHINIIKNMEFHNPIDISKYEYSILLNNLQLDTGLSFPSLGELFSLIQSKSSTPGKEIIRDTITLIPKHRIGNKHKNEIIYVNNDGEANKKQGAGNSAFDLLYYLGWLKINNKIGIEKGDVLTDKQKSKLCPNHSKHKRFHSVWADGEKDQLDKMKSIVNKYFDFELIIIKNSKFSINDGLIIDLKPYPSK